MKRTLDWSSDEAKLVTSLLQKHLPGVAAWAYGSRARWNARPDSDLDLVVFADRSQSASVSALREALEESSLPYRVDLLVWDEIPDNFRPNIEKERVEVSPPAAAPAHRSRSGTWRSCTLGDVVELKRGFDLPQSKRSPGRVPLLSSSGISDLISEAMIKGPGVVTGRYGTIGLVFYVEEDYWPLNTTLYVSDFKGNFPKFVGYFLRSVDFQSCSDKAAVPGVNRNHLHTLPAVIPPLPVQKSIAHILGTLDDKIELNRRINQTLEAMAHALFKSWFVDFDPVKAKIAAKQEGRDPLRAAMSVISGKSESEIDAMPRDQFDQLTETAALFPEEMEESELGMIPKGWSSKNWGDLVTLEYGKSLRDYQSGEGSYRVYGTNGPIGFHDKPLCESAGIVIGRKGAYRGVHYAPEPFFVIDTAFYLLPKSSMSLFWAYYELLRMNINGMDSGSAIPSTSRQEFYGVGVIYPSGKISDEFQRIVSQWHSAQEQLRRESEGLIHIRDALLPKLLSGELEIPDEFLQTESV